MKIELVKTKESDGDWLKVYVDGNIKSCTKIYAGEEEKNLARAMEIYEWFVENHEGYKVIKSTEI
jgi:hypothetical protein